MAVLTERHPAYRAPGPEEAHCYRDARLVFSGCTRIRWRRGEVEIEAEVCRIDHAPVS